jgi:hypothetical protein
MSRGSKQPIDGAHPPGASAAGTNGGDAWWGPHPQLPAIMPRPSPPILSRQMPQLAEVARGGGSCGAAAAASADCLACSISVSFGFAGDTRGRLCRGAGATVLETISSSDGPVRSITSSSSRRRAGCGCRTGCADAPAWLPDWSCTASERGGHRESNYLLP